MTQLRYERAIIRNLHEVGAARFERAALLGLVRSKTWHAWDFFRVAHNALFNDLVAHSIRVLDRNSKSASFWYLHRCNAGAMQEFARRRRMSWDVIETVSDKLKEIRDQTHFHIDLGSVVEPGAVWKSAGLTGNQLGQCIGYVWEILNHLHELHFGNAFEVPIYDGTDVEPIVSAARASGAIPS